MDSVEMRDEQEIEIDLKALFLKIKSLWHVVVIGILIGAIVTVFYSVFLKTPLYESSSMVYLRGSNKSISLEDLNLGTALTKDYEVLFQSRPNMEKVISHLNLDYEAKELAEMIKIENLNDTRILKISVISDDPNLSRDIVNEVVNCGMDNIREIDSQEPYLVEKAIANDQKIGASTLKMGIIGAMVGFIVALGGIFVQFILSDEVQSVDEVENLLGLPVLAVVIEDKALNYAKKKSTKR